MSKVSNANASTVCKQGKRLRQLSEGSHVHNVAIGRSCFHFRGDRLISRHGTNPSITLDMRHNKLINIVAADLLVSIRVFDEPNDEHGRSRFAFLNNIP